MGRLADNVKAKRNQLGISVRELAAKLGVSPGYVSRIEVRNEIPSAEMLCKIADALEIKPEELLDLAKGDVLNRTKEDLSQKHAKALRLYRRKNE
jgi:transcriptional regulator with XRE-family HTH domain